MAMKIEKKHASAILEKTKNKTLDKCIADRSLDLALNRTEGEQLVKKAKAPYIFYFTKIVLLQMYLISPDSNGIA